MSGIFLLIVLFILSLPVAIIAIVLHFFKKSLQEQMDQRFRIQNRRIEKLEKQILDNKLSLNDPNEDLSRENVRKDKIVLEAVDNQKVKKDDEKLKSSFQNINFEDELISSGAKKKEADFKKEIAKESFEEKIGGNLFAKMGIFILIIGIAFFLKYAFDNNWIGEIGRVIIGIIAGVALLIAGEKTINKYPNFGQVISGGGLGVLYLSIFAAYSFYDLITRPVGFIVMTIVMITGVILSFRYNAQALIGFATLGGLLTPILIGSTDNDIIVRFSYILLVDIGILLISVFKKWNKLNILGLIGTVIVAAAWAMEYYDKDVIYPTLFFLTMLFLNFTLASIAYNLFKNKASTGVEQIILSICGFFYVLIGALLVEDIYEDFSGIFVFIVALFYFFLAVIVKLVTPFDEKLYTFLAFFSISLTALSVALVFDGNIVTFAWLLESLLIGFIAYKSRKKSFYYFSLALFALVFFDLIFVESQTIPESKVFLFNKRMFTFFIAIMLSYGLAYIYKLGRKYREEIGDNFAKFMYGGFLTIIICSHFLTIFAVSNEIVFTGKYKIYEIRQEQSELYKQERKGLISEETVYNTVRENRKKIDDIENKRDISLSIFWLIYSVIILIIGFLRNNKVLRVGGIVLLLISILKLFFYDLWSLGTLYRIISSISLGIVLISISFTYNKFKDKIKEII